MKAIAEYYKPDEGIDQVIGTLSDPKLSHQRDRTEVNELVLNLVIQYIARYLETDPKNSEAIKTAAKKAIKKSPEDVMAYLVQSVMAMQGERIVLPIPGLAVESLLDLRATAAIVKEIIFNDRFEKDGPFVGVDLGTGTGILALAGGIAAQRNRMREVLLIGLDIEREVVQKAEKVLGQIFPNRCQMVPADILSPDLWTVFRGLPLSFWISETFGFTTPRMTIDANRLSIHTQMPPEIVAALACSSDPLPQVLGNTMQHRISFFDDVRRGRTAMFPDVVNGLLKPNSDDSTMALTTALDTRHLKLDDVGKEFEEYEDLGTGKTRWRAPDPDGKAEKDMFRLLEELEKAMK